MHLPRSEAVLCGGAGTPQPTGLPKPTKTPGPKPTWQPKPSKTPAPQPTWTASPTETGTANHSAASCCCYKLHHACQEQICDMSQ